MDRQTKALISQLKNAGLSEQAIKAAWPSWWDDAASDSASARAELRFALSRKLGLSPQSLLGERVEFVWKDEARYKKLTASDPAHQAALASFGVALGRQLLRATPAPSSLQSVPAAALRDAVLASRAVVDLLGLLSLCWATGTPVIHIRVFPLRAKSMRAMVVEANGRHAVLLGRDALYPAPIAFTLAHEIGHIALGHLNGGKALVDFGDPDAEDDDVEELQADAYALQLLTGAVEPQITTSIDDFSARELARTSVLAGRPRGIEPGTRALCVGYARQDWAAAQAALKHIYNDPREVWREVNAIAARQLDWSALTDEAAEYLQIVMQGADG